MERETRLELATSSLARRHSTTELPPLIYFRVLFYYYMNIFILQALFLIIILQVTLNLNYSSYTASNFASGVSKDFISIEILSLKAWVNLFTKSFDDSTQNMEAARIFDMPSSSSTFSITGSEP